MAGQFIKMNLSVDSELEDEEDGNTVMHYKGIIPPSNEKLHSETTVQCQLQVDCL